MKNIFKIVAVLLAISMALVLATCGGAAQTNTPQTNVIDGSAAERETGSDSETVYVTDYYYSFAVGDDVITGEYSGEWKDEKPEGVGVLTLLKRSA